MKISPVSFKGTVIAPRKIITEKAMQEYQSGTFALPYKDVCSVTFKPEQKKTEDSLVEKLQEAGVNFVHVVTNIPKSSSELAAMDLTYSVQKIGILA